MTPKSALMVADLDGFKELNDTLGHHAGDLLLKQVGPRMLDALGEVTPLARLGGDEFAVLMPGSRPTRGPEAVNAAAGGARPTRSRSGA